MSEDERKSDDKSIYKRNYKSDELMTFSSANCATKQKLKMLAANIFQQKLRKCLIVALEQNKTTFLFKTIPTTVDQSA